MAFGGYVIEAERIAWSGLAALGVLFVSIAARLREDRDFSLLGSALVLLCLVVAPDVWLPLPAPGVARAWLEAAQDAEQIAACTYVWVGLRFTRSLTGRPGMAALRIHAALLAALCIGFFLDALSPADLFVSVRARDFATTTWVYDWIYSPYLILLFGWNIVLIGMGRREARGERRRTLDSLLFAYALLFLGGVLDFLMMWTGLAILPSSTTVAALAMGGIATYLFTAKLVGLYRSQRESMLKLAEIHGALEVHRPLGDLGRSAAHISESIRGFVAELRTDAESLRRDPATGSRAEVARIENSRKRLEAFTGAILEFSRSAAPRERRLLSPSAWAAECVANLPAAERIVLEGHVDSPISADPAMLQRALGELIRNSLEAGATRVRIRMREGLGRLSIAIEDDGRGFPADQAERIVTPFFTTRKAVGAFGLGASIAHGVFRAHGGSLSYLAAGPGLLANAVLPMASARRPAGPGRGTQDWILVCDDAARMGRFLAVCANVGLDPAVRSGADPRPGAARYGIVDAEADAPAGAPAGWARFRLAGDAPGGDPALPFLTEEALIALAFPR